MAQVNKNGALSILTQILTEHQSHKDCAKLVYLMFSHL
jgi:hypothetical protein